LPKIMLIASSGGHLYELYSLRDFWIDKDRTWICFSGQDSRHLLADEKVFWAYSPTNRNIKNLIKNFFLALRLLHKEKPDALLSTGAGVAVPFILAGKILGKKTLFIESITRYKNISLSAKLIYPFVDKIYVQWPELAERYKKTDYAGRIL